MLPMIGPGLLWFVRLRICIEIVKLYRRFEAEPPAPCPPPMENGLAGPPRPPPPLGPPPPGPPLPPPSDDAAPASRDEPNANVLPIRMFSMIWPGPRPKLRG